ncbi:hypothetical protein LSP04_06140 [Levilactobacillus spicheri]|uniref:Uncharacterized protein n=1 Tax=Levilactobacillus spicheri TaxID=216463 RepID=A0ABQ0WNQ8_9LACO|nr:hypothetical protein LSP04_06140 [Levilactobacillus spicheri]
MRWRGVRQVSGGNVPEKLFEKNLRAFLKDWEAFAGTYREREERSWIGLVIGGKD